jgi:hypothetical protein
MAATSPFMGLKVWNLLTDSFDHTQFAENLAKLDQHNHAEGKGVKIPTGGIEDGAISTAKIATAAITDAKYLNAPIRGVIAAAGTITYGTGFTVAHTASTGIYTITFSSALPTVPVVLPESVGTATFAAPSATPTTTTTAIVNTFNLAGTATDEAFHFIAFPS